MWWVAFVILAVLAGKGLPVVSHAQQAKTVKEKVVRAEPAWKSLFDGKSLQGWKITNFGGEGEVLVEDGIIDMGMGSSLTGITYLGRIPKCDYEVRVEAMRIDGIDFFSTITFPVKDSFCSLVVGGWAGAVVGISCINLADASENETTSFMKFNAKQWYRIRLQVREDRLRAWIDDEQVVNVEIKDRRLSTRPEVSLCEPFGIACWETRAGVRKIELRELKREPEDAPGASDNTPPPQKITPAAKS